MEKANSDDRPPTKRIRLQEPDLQVTVGSGENVKTFEAYSVLLAHHSEYIDRMLSSNMKEDHAKAISFPDIEPDVWADMMKFLRNGKVMGIEDAKRLFPWYDKYAFTDMICLCDEIFANYIEGIQDLPSLIMDQQFLSLNDDLVNTLDIVVELTSFSHYGSLPKTRAAGVKSISQVLNHRQARLSLRVNHLSALQPIICSEQTLWDPVASALGSAGEAEKELLEGDSRDIVCKLIRNRFAVKFVMDFDISRTRISEVRGVLAFCQFDLAD